MFPQDTPVHVSVLASQATYRCRHSGACCTAGWPIPVEAPLAATLRRALTTGKLRLEHAAGEAAQPLDARPDLPAEVGALLGMTSGGRCLFRERSRGLCSIHRQLGPAVLPASCAHFPRVCLIDQDGVHVSLSHYCPTVASLLFDQAGATTPVPAPASLLAGLRPEGLDAREAWPPLLRPDMLADRGGYRRWERFVVQRLGSPGGTPEARLREVAAVTESIRAWRPGGRPFEETVGRACGARAEVAGPPAGLETRVASTLEIYGEVWRTVPPRLAPAAPGPGIEEPLTALVANGWSGFDAAVGRYLAAKAFANWCAYQGRGLRTVLHSVVAALAVLRVEVARSPRPLDKERLLEAVRRADLLLLHLASREALASRFSAVERESAAHLARTI